MARIIALNEGGKDIKKHFAGSPYRKRHSMMMPIVREMSETL